MIASDWNMRMAVMNEGRHHALGIDGLVARLELLAGEDVDRRFPRTAAPLSLSATRTRKDAIDRQNP